MKRGRKKGEMVGCGIVQTFIDRRGGLPWLIAIYNNLGSMEKVAEAVFIAHGFVCSPNSLRYYAYRRGVSFVVNHGGYRWGVRKSKGVKIEVPA